MRTFQILIFSLFVFLFSVQTANAQRRTNPKIGNFKAVNVQVNSTTLVVNGIPAEEYQSYFNSYTKRGYRPVAIDGFLHRAGVANNGSTETYFNVIFELDKTTFASYHGLTGAAYQQKFNDLTGKGYRLSFIESYLQNGEIRYAPIFTKEVGPAWKAVHGLTQAAYQKKFNDFLADGYRLVNRSVVIKGGQKYVAALFDKANVGSWVAKSNLSVAATQTEMEQQKIAGKKVAYMDVTQETTSKITFSPIFDKAPHNAWYALNNLTDAQLKAEIAKANNNGYKTILVMGFDKSLLINGNEVNQIQYAAAWVK
ncbi:MAG: hypothetical protein R3E32_00800 [Chitinophagales bacterium]